MTSRSDVLDGSDRPTPSVPRAGPSFGDFFEDARRSLLPHLRRTVGAGADDVFQDALLIAFQRWDEVREMDHPMAWTRIVATRLAGRRRDRDRRRPLLESLVVRPVDDALATLDHDLLPALAALRPELADAFRFTQLEDLDIHAAAERLGVADGTVKTWVHRSRRHLAAHATGLAGRWVCEEVASPASLERALTERGHVAHIDDAMVCLVDRPVRWELHLGHGRYQLFTDDGETMDQGGVQLGATVLSLTSVATSQTVGGVRTPVTPGSDPGVSTHRFELDGDRLRLHLLTTDISPTNGVPDHVYREVYFDDIVYRWAGPRADVGNVPLG